MVATAIGAQAAHLGAPRAVQAAPAPLPSDRLQFGLSNLDVTWMTSSGVPWKYRFQYLSAGVNTGKGWETWQDPAKPPGQFAADFMTASTTAPAAYIPVFTYYELLQSTPSTGSSESDRDFSNLNNAATMNAYYANFKLLMQKAGAYGAQVVVHVEPDFWGYMQQRAAGGGAGAVGAMVASSGFAEAAGLPDNLIGFTSELKFLRDTYAPSALLAMHASMWSSGIDLASNTDPSINAPGEADKTAAFLNSSGAAGWDAVFNDVDDHNAAWWELASCGSPPCVNQNYTHWWDAANVKFPNFTRYEAWVGELHTQTSKPQVVWQVPMGNQYFLTMNNTCGHYQDNVAPYFIAHANELFNSGLVAVLFGAGNSCQTTYDDARGDGVTNNGGVATTDALGGCNACNTNTSVYPDDDGGYLRIFVRAYYTACKSASLMPSVPGPQTPGASIAFTASSTGCTSPEYRFFLQPPGGSWAAQTAYGGAVWTWNTAGLSAGIYGVGVWVRAGGSGAAYEAYWIGTYTLSVATCTSASLATATASPQAPGALITFNAVATGCPGAQFRFWMIPHGSVWTMQRDYGAASWVWDTTALTPGTYELGVWARQPGSTNAYDAYGFTTFAVGTGNCISAGLSPNLATPQAPGATVIFTATSNSCTGALYQFWLLRPGYTWQARQLYSAMATWSWDTNTWPVGTYQVGVWVKASTSTAAYDTFFIGTFQLNVGGGCTSASISASPASPQVAGTAITVNATSTDCGAPTYEFWKLPPPGSAWSVAQPYGAPASLAWTTSGLAPGPYRIGVWARQSGSANSYDSYAILTFWVG